MSDTIATLCGTVTAVSSAAIGLSFASEDTHTCDLPASPPPPTHPDSLRYRSHPAPTTPRSMLDTAHSTPTRSPPRSLSRRISSIHESFASPDPVRASDASRVSRPWPSRRSTSHSDQPSHSSGREGTVRSNVYSSSSAQPFISPGAVTTPNAPNKLVKRSFSQRGPHSAPPSSFKKLHLKRPATSHQRSATWSMQNFEASRNQDIRPVAAYTDPRPAVKSKHLLQVHSVKKRGSREHETLHIRHIRSNGATPVLLPASSVAAPEVVYVEEAKETDSRKAPRISSSPLSSSPRLASEEVQTPPKRFLQQNDAGPLKRGSRSSPQSKLMRKLSRRLTSAPALHIRSSSMDPEKHGQHQEAHPQQQPPAPSGPFNFNESESDASSPATPTSLPFKLLHRRARQSATSSDQTSSRPGSEGGPRVFSWAEGFDDDLNSDTVYDSIRTGTTRSTSGYPRPGLETLFDQSTASLDSKGVKSHIQPQPWSAEVPDPGPNPRSDVPNFALPSTPVQHSPSTRLRTEGAYEGEWDVGDNTDARHAHHASSPPAEDQGLEGHSTRLSPREAGLKNSLFDWSEQPALERGTDDGPPPRPKTAHPKKQLDPRGGGLSTGRRAPSGLHSRSHSVPVLQDLVARQSDTSNKFGSWGIGTKGATEAWDNDFDFEEGDFNVDDVGTTTNDADNEAVKRLSGSMVVPDKIQRQQSNVLANISLLREWGILIEELKDLRARATTLGARTGENSEVFDEVDAMIDLADQEAEEDGVPGVRSPASSQTFSEDDFDQITPPRSETAARARLSPSEMLRVMQRNKPARASPRVDSPEAFQRPRQDSEAMARSVIEALQRWRKPGSGEATSTPQGRPKKVPFDTATLRHIVPHVHNLMRKVKQMLRELEGLNMSPRADEETEATTTLSQAFRPQQQMGEESPGAQKERRLRLKRGMGRTKTPPLDEGELRKHVQGLMID